MKENIDNQNKSTSIFNSNKYHFQNIFEEFETTQEGLDLNEVTFRLKKYGPNKIIIKKTQPLILKFLSEFKDFMMILLLIAATISLITKSLTDAFLIYLVVLANAIISFMQKNKAEKAVEALKQLVAPQARVIRQNKQYLISTTELVPGDLLILNEGDIIPGDAIIYEANEFEINESVLTGESNSVHKLPFNIEEKGAFTNLNNIVFSGTVVSRGNAMAITFKTGSNTEFGKITNLTLSTKKGITPLEREMKTIGTFSATLVLIISALIFAYEILFTHVGLIETFIFVASLAVAAVPEGLPATITIALTLGVQRLSKKNAIVKQLASAETLGTCNVICTDKTGTITKNEMTVTAAFLDQYSINFSGIGYQPYGKIELLDKNETLQFDLTNPEEKIIFSKKYNYIESDLFLLASCANVCNNASISKKDNKYISLGDPTEASLFPMIAKLGFDQKTLSNQFHKLHELPFDSNRKLMTVIAKNLQNNKIYVFTKGAPEQILNICDQKISKAKTTLLTKSQLEDISQLNTKLAASALRSIAFAYKEITAKDLDQILANSNFDQKTHNLERKMNFIGLTAMHDPPREEVKKAIAITKLAGIRTYILTGDHGLTAAKIAESVGLISKENPADIIHGEELSHMSDNELENLLTDQKTNFIFARINPEHKLRIVTALQNLKNIVAVTGDGVNDAPALKKADIGICMGLTGTDISREASNLVLADDSFFTIVTAIQEGRIIYANLKKFSHYIFSSNIGEIVTIVFSIILGIQSPLTAVLLLTINLATDLFPALALGVEPGEKNIMEKPPRRYDQRIINTQFASRVLIIGFGIGVILLGTILIKLFIHGWQIDGEISQPLTFQLHSLIFANLVFIQIINAYNSRSDSISIFKQKFFQNPKLFWACLLSFILTIALIYLPQISNSFQLAPLNILDWIMLISSSLLIILIDEVYKYFRRRKLSLTPAKVTI